MTTPPSTNGPRRSTVLLVHNHKAGYHSLHAPQPSQPEVCFSAEDLFQYDLANNNILAAHRSDRQLQPPKSSHRLLSDSSRSVFSPAPEPVAGKREQASPPNAAWRVELRETLQAADAAILLLLREEGVATSSQIPPGMRRRLKQSQTANDRQIPLSEETKPLTGVPSKLPTLFLPPTIASLAPAHGSPSRCSDELSVQSSVDAEEDFDDGAAQGDPTTPDPKILPHHEADSPGHERLTVATQGNVGGGTAQPRNHPALGFEVTDGFSVGGTPLLLSQSATQSSSVSQSTAIQTKLHSCEAGFTSDGEPFVDQLSAAQSSSAGMPSHSKPMLDIGPASKIAFAPAPPRNFDGVSPAPPPIPPQRRAVNPRRLPTKATIVGPRTDVTTPPEADTAPESRTDRLSVALLNIIETVLDTIRRVTESETDASQAMLKEASPSSRPSLSTPETFLPTESEASPRAPLQVVDSTGRNGVEEDSLPLARPTALVLPDSAGESFKSHDADHSSSGSRTSKHSAGTGNIKQVILPPYLSRGRGAGPVLNRSLPLSMPQSAGVTPLHQADRARSRVARLSLVAATIFGVRDLCAADCTAFRSVNLASPPPQSVPQEAAEPVNNSKEPTSVHVVLAAPAGHVSTLQQVPPATMEVEAIVLGRSSQAPEETDIQVGRPAPAGLVSVASWQRLLPSLSHNHSDVESFYGGGGQLQRLASASEADPNWFGEVTAAAAAAPVPVSQLQGTVVVDDSGCAVLCQFEIVAELGKGNFGKVSLVVDAEGELFALKTLYGGAGLSRSMPGKQMGSTGVADTESSGSDTPTAAFAKARDKTSSHNQAALVEREIAVMKRLNHPNVVKLHAVIEDPEEGQTHLVMQYVDNGPIGKVARDNTCRPLPFTLALKYMAQVARGLEYLHSQNIIHRDIKPENILIGSDDTAYVADFGVSSITSEEENLRVMMGTMSFFSPELLASPTALKQYGKESDVWAFGVTLYCLLFGKLPFTGHTGPALMRAILMEDLIIPDYFPEIEQDCIDGSDLLPDSCPFICRHLEEVAELKQRGPVKVPEAFKDLLRGLLLRDPAQRLTLPRFRRSKLVRRVITIGLPMSRRPPAGAPPVDALTSSSPATSVGRDASDAIVERKNYDEMKPTDAPLLCILSTSNPLSETVQPDTDPLNRQPSSAERSRVMGEGSRSDDSGLGGGPLPMASISATSAASLSDALGRSSGTEGSSQDEVPAHCVLDDVTMKEIEQAITHCNIVMVRRRGRSVGAVSNADTGVVSRSVNVPSIQPNPSLPPTPSSGLAPSLRAPEPPKNVSLADDVSSSPIPPHTSAFVQRYRDLRSES